MHYRTGEKTETVKNKMFLRCYILYGLSTEFLQADVNKLTDFKTVFCRKFNDNYLNGISEC